MVAGNTPNPSGIFTSADDGATWTAIVIPPVGFSLYSVAGGVDFDSQHSGTVYASGQGLPLFKSTDGGQTWTTLAAVYGPVTVDPSNPAIMYSLTGLGIQKSTDGGNSFVKTGFVASDLTDLEIDPATPSRIYAASNVALYTSGDAGATWTATSVRSVSQMAVLPGRVVVGGLIPPETYLAKFSPGLSQLLWATYLGGGGYQTVTAMAVDPAGNAYLTGTTVSARTFLSLRRLTNPAASRSYRRSVPMERHCWRLRFGTATYPTAIAVDGASAVYVAGRNPAMVSPPRRKPSSRRRRAHAAVPRMPVAFSRRTAATPL